MLQSAIELRGAKFLWACDLSQSDTVAVIPGLQFPVNPMPLLMGVTMIIQARLTPPSPGMDPAQQKIMKYMPMIFVVILYNFSAALTLGVIIRIFGRVAKAPVINLRVVINAITVYLMLGLFFAYLYMTLSAAADEGFFTQGPGQPTSVFLYFSYITLATIGYGDFTPAHTIGRFAAVAEGLMGQLYLVTILAVIVSNLGAKRKPPGESSG